MHVVLVAPENPYNTGGVARTCALVGASLHLVQPFGFVLGKDVRRASMSYLDAVPVCEYPSIEDLLAKIPPEDTVACFDEVGDTAHTEFSYGPTPWLLFGSESVGLPDGLPFPYVRIPMPGLGSLSLGPDRADHRTHSLNVSASVAIAVYEVLRQQNQ